MEITLKTEFGKEFWFNLNKNINNYFNKNTFKINDFNHDSH